MKQLFLLLLFGCLGLSVIKAQNPGSVTGVVTSSSASAPLAHVTIQEKGTSNAVSSDDNGAFTIRIRKSPTVLVISYVGFNRQEVSASAGSNLRILLSPATQGLDSVVVTAMGIKRDPRSLGYSTQTVTSSELNVNHQPNVVNALQGKVAGVQITSGGGAPGQGSSIMIRGINSIDPNRSNQPLFVIDGVEIDNNTYSLGDDATTTRGMSNRAADINPDDIENISVLKGGAATALYGIRAANGAIVITTKAGRKGRISAAYNGMYSIDKVNRRPDVQDKFTQGWAGEYDSTSFWPNFGPTVADAQKEDPTVPSKLFNNYERAFKTGNQMRHTVNVSGGNDMAQFYGSMSYFKQNGIMYFSDYKSYNGRVGGEFNISSKVKAGASINFINSGGLHPNYDRYGEELIYWANRWDVRNYIKPDGTMASYPALAGNPIYINYTNRFTDDVNRTISSAHISYMPTDWLNFTYRFGNDFFDDNRKHTAPGPKGVPDEIEVSDNGNGIIAYYDTKNRIITSTFVADFNKKLGDDFTLDLKLGHDLRDQRLRQTWTEGSNLLVSDYFVLQNAQKIVAGNYAVDSRIFGYFADVNVSYKDLLYLELTDRNDHSSNLAPGNRSYYYPSASLSYIFSEQFKLPAWWSYGKIRLSYAKIGKDGSPYAITNGFSANTPIGSVIPYQESTVAGNIDLRPEFTSTSEVGTELRFLNNRLGLDVTGYWGSSKDLIVPVSISNSTGFDQAYKNAGKINNRGLEITVTGKPVITPDFSWDFMVNFSTNRNKVISLNEDLGEIILDSHYGYASSTVTDKLVPGYSSGALFGRSYARYYGDEHDDGKTVRKDLPIVIGADGFPVIDTKQRFLGNSLPTWMANTTQNFRYKNWTFSFLFDIRQGQYRYNQLSNFLASFGQMKFQENSDQTIVFDGVTADGQKNAKAVYLGQGVGPDGVNYGNGFYRNVYRGSSENFIENGSWVRLRTVSLAYSIPKKILSKSNSVKGVTVSVIGNNLWLNTKWKGYDPESSSRASGSNSAGAFAGFVYPGLKNIMFNLNLQF